MIRIEHLNLVVSDIEATRTFYQTAFPHWQVRASGDGEWSGKARKWLHLGDNDTYITLNDNGVDNNRARDGHQIGMAHFAFTVDNLEAVKARLMEAEYKISNAGSEATFRRNIYFIDPSGFEVEFVQYLSDIPAERNSDN